MNQRPFRTYSLAIFFLVLIAFPLVNSRFHLISDIKSSENRKMASSPEFDFSTLDSYPGLFEKSYNDNFTLRSLIVKYFNKINLEWFHKSPLPDQVIIGKDNWLFMGGEEMDAYRGKPSFEPKELESIRLELEYRKQYLKERGCEFYFFIAPNKTNIYSDKLPGNVFRLSQDSWGEQLMKYLNERSSVKPINVFDLLKANKAKEDLYFRLDHHWDQPGAFYGTNELLRVIHQDFPEVMPLKKEEFEIKKFPTLHGNIATMLSDEGSYTDTVHWHVRKPAPRAHEGRPRGYPVEEGFPYPKEYEMVLEIDNSSLPKALLVSDSFGNFMFPLFSEEFSKTVKIFDSWKFKLNENIVNQEKPDVFVLVVLETNLRHLLINQSRSAAKKN